MQDKSTKQRRPKLWRAQLWTRKKTESAEVAPNIHGTTVRKKGASDESDCTARGGTNRRPRERYP